MSKHPTNNLYPSRRHLATLMECTKRLFPDLAHWNLADVADHREYIEKFRTSDPLFMGLDDGSNERIPAGYTYLGQFIAHDMSFDPTTMGGRQGEQNFRTPKLDLDSVYGGGPIDNPILYNQKGALSRTHFYLDELPIGPGGKHIYDLPRKHQGDLQVALVADSRNDDNIIISQLHLSFLLFHNKVVDQKITELRGALEEQLQPPKGGEPPMYFHGYRQQRSDQFRSMLDEAFSEARRTVTWNFHWIILHDFLPRIVGKELVEEILGEKLSEPLPSDFSGQINLKYFHWQDKPFIPVEFSVAAFRFGHSMVRKSYNFVEQCSENVVNSGIFQAKMPHRAPDEVYVDWSLFFFAERQRRRTNFSRLINPLVAFAMVEQLPDPHFSQNIVYRNLENGRKTGLPSGQSVARAMGEPPVDHDRFQQEGSQAYQVIASQFPDIGGTGDKQQDMQNFCNESPLWFYTLMEAEVEHDGTQLGPAGGRLVAEVILGILFADQDSFLRQCPDWTPDYYDELNKNSENGDLSMLHFLRAAGVYPVPFADTGKAT